MNGEQCEGDDEGHINAYKLQMVVTHVFMFLRSQSICKIDLRPVDSADKSVKSI